MELTALRILIAVSCSQFSRSAWNFRFGKRMKDDLDEPSQGLDLGDREVNHVQLKKSTVKD